MRRMFRHVRAWHAALLAAVVMVSAPACATQTYPVRGSYVSADFERRAVDNGYRQDSTRGATMRGIIVRSRPIATERIETRGRATAATGRGRPTDADSPVVSKPAIATASTATPAAGVRGLTPAATPFSPP
jgi:hypothetical protein